MVANISTEFKKLWEHKEIDVKLFVPLFRWCSGYEPNIEVCQKINRRFGKVNNTVLKTELTLGNKLKHFIKYPKELKDDEKTKFFYSDLCKYFGWTLSELQKNLPILNIDSLKEIISRAYGYNNVEREILKLKPIKINNKNIK